MATSCASTEALSPGSKPVEAPAALTALCRVPVALADDTLGSLSDALIENTAALQDCADRHAKLVEFVKP